MNAITNTPTTNTRMVIESNHMDGKWIDRIYQLGITEEVELINKDSTRYQGKIHRRRITLQNAHGENFFAAAYESTDGRWFDNCGMPMKKPTDVSQDIENEVSI